jgi:ribosome-associated translation inhibitor RaiA
MIKGNANWIEAKGMKTAEVRLNGVGEQANGKFDCVCKVAIRNGNQYVIAYQAKNKQVFRVTGESDSPVAAIDSAVAEIAEQIAAYSRQAYCSNKGIGYTKPEAVAFTGALWL